MITPSLCQSKGLFRTLQIWRGGQRWRAGVIILLQKLLTSPSRGRRPLGHDSKTFWHQTNLSNTLLKNSFIMEWDEIVWAHFLYFLASDNIKGWLIFSLMKCFKREHFSTLSFKVQGAPSSVPYKVNWNFNRDARYVFSDADTDNQ